VSSATTKDDTKIISHDHEYDFSNIYRGLAVIISNGQFKKSLPRSYCDDELTMMKETFGSKVLKFTVLAFKDLTAEQMGWVLDIGKKYFLCRMHIFEEILSPVISTNVEKLESFLYYPHQNSDCPLINY